MKPGQFPLSDAQAQRIAAFVDSIMSCDNSAIDDHLAFFQGEGDDLEVIFTESMRVLLYLIDEVNHHHPYFAFILRVMETLPPAPPIRYAMMVGHIDTGLRCRVIRNLATTGDVSILRKAIGHLYGRNMIYDSIINLGESELYSLIDLGPVAAPAMPSLVSTMSQINHNLDYTDTYQSMWSVVLELLECIGAGAGPAVPFLVELIERGMSSFQRNRNLPVNSMKVLASIGYDALSTIPLLHKVLENPGRYGSINEVLPTARNAIASIAKATEEAAHVTQWDLQASTYIQQLKMFYLLGRLYKEGKNSVRSVAEALRGLESQLFAEDMPTSNVSFSDNTEQLEPLFANMLAEPNFVMFVKRKGFSNQLSDAGWRAWAWTEGFLRRRLPADWFGFSRLSPH